MGETSPEICFRYKRNKSETMEIATITWTLTALFAIYILIFDLIRHIRRRKRREKKI